MSSIKKYGHIARDTVIRELAVSKEQMAAILHAYDYGINCIDKEDYQQLTKLINDMKDILHP